MVPGQGGFLSTVAEAGFRRDPWWPLWRPSICFNWSGAQGTVGSQGREKIRSQDTGALSPSQPLICCVPLSKSLCHSGLSFLIHKTGKVRPTPLLPSLFSSFQLCCPKTATPRTWVLSLGSKMGCESYPPHRTQLTLILTATFRHLVSGQQISGHDQRLEICSNQLAARGGWIIAKNVRGDAKIFFVVKQEKTKQRTQRRSTGCIFSQPWLMGGSWCSLWASLAFLAPKWGLGSKLYMRWSHLIPRRGTDNQQRNQDGWETHPWHVPPFWKPGAGQRIWGPGRKPCLGSINCTTTADQMSRLLSPQMTSRRVLGWKVAQPES